MRRWGHLLGAAWKIPSTDESSVLIHTVSIFLESSSVSAMIIWHPMMHILSSGRLPNRQWDESWRTASTVGREFAHRLKLFSSRGRPLRRHGWAKGNQISSNWRQSWVQLTNKSYRNYRSWRPIGASRASCLAQCVGHYCSKVAPRHSNWRKRVAVNGANHEGPGSKAHGPGPG